MIMISRGRLIGIVKVMISVVGWAVAYSWIDSLWYEWAFFNLNSKSGLEYTMMSLGFCVVVMSVTFRKEAWWKLGNRKKVRVDSRKESVEITTRIGKLGIMAVAITTVVGALWRIGNGDIGVVAGMYHQNLWVQIGAIVVLAPLGEEVLCRGIIYGKLKREFGLWTALVLQAVIFGVMHKSLMQAVLAVAVGLILGLVREETGTVWFSWVGHMVLNLVAVVMSNLTIAVDEGVLVLEMWQVVVVGSMCIGLLGLVVYKFANMKLVEIKGSRPVGVVGL
jgi:membrane protease YdiL (CAAX protease family)